MWCTGRPQASLLGPELHTSKHLLLPLPQVHLRIRGQQASPPGVDQRKPSCPLVCAPTEVRRRSGCAARLHAAAGGDLHPGGHRRRAGAPAVQGRPGRLLRGLQGTLCTLRMPGAKTSWLLGDVRPDWPNLRVWLAAVHAGVRWAVGAPPLLHKLEPAPVWEQGTLRMLWPAAGHGAGRQGPGGSWGAAASASSAFVCPSLWRGQRVGLLCGASCPRGLLRRLYACRDPQGPAVRLNQVGGRAPDPATLVTGTVHHCAGSGACPAGIHGLLHLDINAAGRHHVCTARQAALMSRWIMPWFSAKQAPLPAQWRSMPVTSIQGEYSLAYDLSGWMPGL